MPNKKRLPLEVSFYPRSSFEALNQSENVLRLLSFQDSSLDPGLNIGAKEIGAGLFIPAIGSLDTEVWSTPNDITSAKELSSDDKRIRIVKISTPTYSFIRFSCYEKSPDKLITLPGKPNISELDELTYLSYKKMFSLIRKGTLPKNIIRMWNFVPNILGHNLEIKKWDSVNSERYRQFNTGRKQAWVDHSNLQIDKGVHKFRVPAATGIGSHGGPLVIEAMLTNKKIVDIPNPKQINAYSYSDKYGTNQPMFSRATVQLVRGGGLLFIAGTASITGEDTKYDNDPVAQTHQTFKNIQAIINAENLSKYLPFMPNKLNLSDLQGLRVHIKRKAHLPLIKKIVEEYVGAKDICYVQDDICRENLLLEIESNGTFISAK